MWFPVSVSASLLTVHLDFCVTLLFWAASSKKFPLSRASKCDHWITKMPALICGRFMQAKPDLWPRPIAWEEFKGLLPPFSCCHYSAARRKIPQTPKKNQKPNKDSFNECRRNVHCLSITMPDETLLCWSVSGHGADDSHPSICIGDKHKYVLYLYTYEDRMPSNGYKGCEEIRCDSFEI